MVVGTSRIGLHELSRAVRPDTRLELSSVGGLRSRLLADREWFIPLDESRRAFRQPAAHPRRPGYRRNFNWRCELLYIWTRSRDTIDEGFSTTANIVDRRVKRLF